MQQGKISVQSENIFPIIKQFLYSDQEIFLRELVANAVDATIKLLTYAKKGEVAGEVGDTRIQTSVDKENKTITIADKGIGMTEEEVNKYLNQVAFSSAAEFLEQYKDEANVIGHFGLGFYSAFMVADRVEVHTKSYKGDAAVTWSCEGDPEYTMGASEKADRGTDIILHVSEDAVDYLEDLKIQGLLDKYCKFLPVEIQFGTRTETETIGEGEDAKTEEKQVDNVVNNPAPLWKKQPADLTDEDYLAFYQELYPHSAPPLFWIHLNIDYPFDLTGVLYFPKLTNSLEVQKNKIQLYCNQVFVTDDVSAIVPEFLTLLHGVIDSPDIPLNVSRSYLQADKNVKKITGYITKKVADKLVEIFKNDRKDYESKWDSIGPFVKYGMLTEEKFYDRAEKCALLENVDGEFFTLEEYQEKIKETQTDKHDRKVIVYSNNVEEQDSLIAAAKAEGLDVVVSNNVIDNHWMQQLEQKIQNLTFVRVDSDTADNLVQKDVERESVLSEEQQESVKALFTAQAQAGATVELKPLSVDAAPVQITKSEFLRRMMEMQAMQGMDGNSMPKSYNLIVNSNHPIIVDKLINAGEGQAEMTKHLTSLALLNHGMLKGSQLTEFINKSYDILKG